MSGKKVAVVTGSNRGIGLSIVKGLLKADSFQGDVVLTARSEDKGREATAQLEAEGLGADRGLRFRVLDTADETTVEALASFLKENYGGLDILVNNAGFAFNNDATEPFDVQAEQTVRINYWNTKSVCLRLFPLLREGARVVNVSSAAGWLKELIDDDTDIKRTLSKGDLTVEEIDSLMTDFVASAKAGDSEKKGWPKNTYMVSKIGLSALSVVQQRLLDKEAAGKDIVVNHVHPGMVQTPDGHEQQLRQSKC